jgi:hypothetical protein
MSDGDGSDSDGSDGYGSDSGIPLEEFGKQVKDLKTGIGEIEEFLQARTDSLFDVDIYLRNMLRHVISEFKTENGYEDDAPPLSMLAYWHQWNPDALEEEREGIQKYENGFTKGRQLRFTEGWNSKQK